MFFKADQASPERCTKNSPVPTAIAMPINDTSDDVQPLWINRSFDSIYSVAISEQAVYIGVKVEGPYKPSHYRCNRYGNEPDRVGAYRGAEGCGNWRTDSQ